MSISQYYSIDHCPGIINPEMLYFSSNSAILSFMMKFSLPNCNLRAETVLAAGVALGSAAVAWLIAVAVLASMFFLRRAVALLLLAGVLAGALSAEMRQWRFLSPDHYRWLLPERECRAEIQLRVNDRRLTTVPGIAAPTLIETELAGFRLSGETRITPCSGTLYCRWPAEAEPPHFGELVTASGEFELPADAVLNRGNSGAWKPYIERRSFADFLAGRGSARLFDISSVTVLGKSSGWMELLCRWRDGLLAALLEDVDNDKVRNWAAALFFGLSGGISGSDRVSLIESGTIHLFSVSGMHVAVLASLLLRLLFFLPFAWRYRVLSLVVFCYVMTTGAGAPSLRAFFMIALWGELRCRLRWMPPVSALALAASVLLLWNPALIYEVGFLYSFLITGLLLLLAERCRVERPLWRERFECMAPSSLRESLERRFLRNRKWALALGGCIVAFLGGVGISLFSQGLVLPGSIAANVLLLPLVALLYPVFLMKIICNFCGLAPFGAWLLSFSFEAVHTVVFLTAECFSRLPAIRPGLYEVIGFYLLLLAACGGRFRRHRRLSWIVGGAALLLLISWHLRVKWEPPTLLCGYGGRGETVMAAVAEPAAGIAVAVNVPGYDAASAYVEFFRRRGITRIETLYLSRLRMDNIVGIAALRRNFPLGRIVVPEIDRGARRALERLHEEAPGVPVFAGTDPEAYGAGRILPEKAGFAFEYFNRGSTFNRKLIWTKHDSGWSLQLERAGEATLRRDFAYANVLEVFCDE